MRPAKAPAAVALTLIATLPACARQGTPAGTPTANEVSLHATAVPAQIPPGLPSLMAVPPSGMPIGCTNRIAARPIPPNRGAASAAPPPANPRAANPPAATPPAADPRAAAPPAAVPPAADPRAAAPPAAAPPAADPRPPGPNVADSDAAERARQALKAANPPVPRRAPIPPEAAAIAESCARSLQPELTLLAASPGGLADEQSLRRILTSAGMTKIIVQPGPAFAAAAGKACVYGTFPNGRPELSIGPQQPNGSCHP